MKAMVYFLVVLMCVSARASVEVNFPTVQDDPEIKYKLWQDPQVASLVEADRKRLAKLVDALRPCSASYIKSVFGADIGWKVSYVLPFSHASGCGISGLTMPGKKGIWTCQWFIPIGDVGAILVCADEDTNAMIPMAVYLKIDSKFRPIRVMKRAYLIINSGTSLFASSTTVDIPVSQYQPEDLAARREWERQKLDELEKIIFKKLDVSN